MAWFQSLARNWNPASNGCRLRPLEVEKANRKQVEGCESELRFRPNCGVLGHLQVGGPSGSWIYSFMVQEWQLDWSWGIKVISKWLDGEGGRDSSRERRPRTALGGHIHKDGNPKSERRGGGKVGGHTGGEITVALHPCPASFFKTALIYFWLCQVLVVAHKIFWHANS